MAKSEYLQREEAAKKQLGAKGVKKRVKQLPTAARASLREMTGIDVSRKGVSVDPMGVAMALPVGKVLKAAKALRGAGVSKKAMALEARVVAKKMGRNIPKEYSWFERGLASGPKTPEGKFRTSSESVFPRLPSRGGDSPSLLRGSRDIRTFDKYADLTNEGAGRFTGRKRAK